jgi:iron complex outermembrane receptor protein
MGTEQSMRRCASLCAAATMMMSSTCALAQATQNLADLTLEELSNLAITSVSKRAERLSDAPASVFVITADDLRHAGVTNLPDALRLAPNLQVAQLTADQTTISARGFNNNAGNKLLVLIDGRTVYSPLFSGVFWDAQDVMLEDVERIEVVSGPGGTLWGVNAVNGVINVITRAAKDTQGGLVTLTGGNLESTAAARYGGTAGENGHFRVYGKYFDRQHGVTQDGTAIHDEWHKKQAGFRADWAQTNDQLTLQGDVYDGREAQPEPGTINITGVVRPLNLITISGLNLLGRLQHQLEGGSAITVQAYYDHTERDVPGTFDDRLDVIDLQFQHALPLGQSNALIWGAQYRYGMDEVLNSDFIAFLPSKVKQVWGSLFAQDKISLSDDVQLTLGARAETNDYTKPEFLPSIRLAWKVASDHLLWTAASRTVRAPSRIDRDFYYPAQAPFLINGGPQFQSEVAKVYELGYRGQPTSSTSLSVTVFHTVYDRLRTLEASPLTVLPFYFGNEMEGTATGLEAWGTVQATPSWRLSAGLTTMNKDLRLKPGSAGLNGGISAEGNDPDLSWNLRSNLNLSDQVELDAVLRHVSELPQPQVPEYTVLDLRLGWRPRPGLELSLGGRNLLGHGHAEFGNLATRGALASGVYLTLSSKF